MKQCAEDRLADVLKKQNQERSLVHEMVYLHDALNQRHVEQLKQFFYEGAKLGMLLAIRSLQNGIEVKGVPGWD